MGYVESVKSLTTEIKNIGGKILITGATGLIGTCIINALIEDNHINDKKWDIYALSRSVEKIKERFYNQVTPVIQNITEPINITEDFDFIIHGASNADPQTYVLHPVDTIMTNIIGSSNICEYCKAHPKTRMIFLSSFEVYGKIEGIDTYDETMSGVIDMGMLRNGYPESKRCTELMIRSYVEEFGIDAIIARLASIYGPTMSKDDSKAHAQFIRSAVEGEDIVLKSKGLPRRTYCYVIDAVSAIFTLLEKGCRGETYNIANEKSVVSISEVAQTCATIASTKVIFDFPNEIESKGFSKPINCILDNKKLKSLSWNGRYDLFTGLSETIEYLRNS